LGNQERHGFGRAFFVDPQQRALLSFSSPVAISRFAVRMRVMNIAVLQAITLSASEKILLATITSNQTSINLTLIQMDSQLLS
jgi:hypothetical protein